MEEESKKRKVLQLINSCSFINSVDHLLVLLHYTTRVTGEVEADTVDVQSTSQVIQHTIWK